MKIMVTLFCAAVFLSGCATVPQPRTIDWPAAFAAYGATPDDQTATDRTKLETLFSGNKAQCTDNIRKTLANANTSRDAYSGAADAAGFLKAAACLPTLESQLLTEQDWFRRFACANAIDSIDAESSKPAVIPALEREINGMVVMAIAMYLTRHPSPEEISLLERKNAEFSKNDDDSSVIACLFLEDALTAAKNTVK